MTNRCVLFFAASLLASVLGGCAAHPDPIVDTLGVNEEQLARDWEDCEAYAEQVKPSRAAARGAAVGAVAGAAAGAIGGSADRGAGYGGIAGATRSGIGGSREKQAVFKRCLRGRGYRVLN